MRTHSEPQGKAMYVASQSDKDWLLSVQRKLYTQSQKDLSYVFEKLWGFITDSRNLRVYRTDAKGAARRRIPAGCCSARSHPEARTTREVSPPRHPDRAGPYGSGCDEEHLGADL